MILIGMKHIIDGTANMGDEIMKRKIYCTLMITAACLTIWGCAGNTSDETTSSIFEPQTEAVGAQNDNQDTVEQSIDTNKSCDNQRRVVVTVKRRNEYRCC